MNQDSFSCCAKKTLGPFSTKASCTSMIHFPNASERLQSLWGLQSLLPSTTWTLPRGPQHHTTGQTKETLQKIVNKNKVS